MGKSPATAESTAEQKQLMQGQLGILQEQHATEKAFEPFYLQKLGLKKDASGQYTQMTDAERFASMSPDEQSAYTTRIMIAQRLKNALSGEGDVSAAMEFNLGNQQKDIENYLTQKLGADWNKSTAGAQSLSDYNTNSNIIREETRRSGIPNYTGLLLNAQDQAYNDLSNKIGLYQGYANRNQSMFNALGDAIQPMENYKSMRQQYNNAKAQQKTGNITAAGMGAATIAAIGIAI